MTIPLIFTATVVVLILAFNSIAIRQFWRYYRDLRRPPDFVLDFRCGDIAFHWLVDEPATDAWREAARLTVVRLAVEGARLIPGWNSDTLSDALRRAAPHLRVVVIAGDSYQHQEREYHGHYSRGAITIAHKNGQVSSTALVHELIHFVDDLALDIQDPDHRDWVERGEVERAVREGVKG